MYVFYLTRESKTYFVGEVKDRDCVIVDDIIDSGLRVCNAVAACKAHGMTIREIFFTCDSHDLCISE